MNNFNKNSFFKNNPTKISGDKIIVNKDHFELTRELIKKNSEQNISKNQLLPQQSKIDEQRKKISFFKNPF